MKRSSPVKGLVQNNHEINRHTIWQDAHVWEVGLRRKQTNINNKSSKDQQETLLYCHGTVVLSAHFLFSQRQHVP